MFENLFPLLSALAYVVQMVVTAAVFFGALVIIVMVGVHEVFNLGEDHTQDEDLT